MCVCVCVYRELTPHTGGLHAYLYGLGSSAAKEVAAGNRKVSSLLVLLAVEAAAPGRVNERGIGWESLAVRLA